MAFAFVGNANAVGTGVTSLTCNRPAGVAVGNLIVAVYAFENVAAGSGPWIIPNAGQFSTNFIGPAEGWQQVCWQAPSAAGVGIEVWAAIHGSGATQAAQFAAAQNVTTVTAAWSGEYNPTNLISGGAVRVATPAQATGNQPPAPSVAANSGELIIACAGDLMTGALFGTPSGFTSRVDVARAGAGTVEATIADAVAPIAGPTGLIIFPNAAAAAATRGATATLAIIPTPTGATVGPILDVPMPEDLDLGAGWTLRITALDPVTGAVVPGVTVANLAMEIVDVNGVGPPGLEFGEFLLVPGPGA